MIRQVWMKRGHGFTDAERNSNSQLLITIPMKNEQGIVDGDCVEVRKVKPPWKKIACKVCKRPYVEHTVKELYQHGLLELKK